MQRLTKKQIIDMILKQNCLLDQQSDHIFDLTNLTNSVETQTELKKCQIMQQQNEICKKTNNIRQQQIQIYENSIKIQIVLFALFVLVLLWLMYHMLSYRSE